MTERSLPPPGRRPKPASWPAKFTWDGQKEDKAGTMFPETVQIEVRGNLLPYVSRGGLKLEKAMKNFGDFPGRQSVHGCRGLHRRFYRLYAAKSRV